jgi:Cu/Ag efflux pump CusA
VYRPASYLELALRNSAWALGAGLVLVVLVLLVLHGWRSAVVAAVTVPLSMVAAGLVLFYTGTTMNLMLWAGLIVASAALVDDAVVSYESTRRGSAVDGTAARHESVADALAAAARPLAFATVIMIAASVPLLYLAFSNGLDLDFILPIALSYTLALAASLIVAVVVAPTLALLLIGRAKTQMRSSRPAERLRLLHTRLLQRGLMRPGLATAAFAMVALAGLLLVPTLDIDMKPAPAERTFLIHWAAAPGTSHPEMSRITSRVADEVRAVPGVANVGAHIGRAITSDELGNVNSGELWAALEDDADSQEVLSSLRTVVSGYPGIEQEVLTYTDERSTALGVGSTAAEEVVVRVYGQEYGVLAEKAEEVRSALDGLDGLDDADTVTIETPPQEAQVEVEVDLAAARAAGVTPGAVRRAAATMVAGIEVGSLFEQQKVFEVVVIGSPETRHDLDAVTNLLIDSPDGGSVRLGDVAQVEVVPVPTSVRHNSVSRFVDVVADVSGGDVNAVAEEAEEALAAVVFPLEYHAEILTDYSEEQTSMTRALGFALGALVLMFLLLQAYLRSWRLAELVFVGLPLALSGALLTAVLARLDLDIGVILGLLLLTGVYVRSALLLLARYEALGVHAGQRPDLDRVVRGAEDRFIPTFASLVAVAAFVLPTVVLGREPGLELLQPMSVVTLGGMVTTAVTVLFFLPVMYQRTSPDIDSAQIDDTAPRDTPSPVGIR